MTTPVEPALHQASADLDALGARWALVGGLAVSVRGAPRFTKDIEVARDALRLIQQRGFNRDRAVLAEFASVLTDLDMSN